MTAVTMHGVRRATVRAERGKHSHWLLIQATDADGAGLEIVLFHDGSLALETAADADASDAYAPWFELDQQAAA